MEMNTSVFDATVNNDTPRLVVLMDIKPNGEERFQWGVVHNIPLLSLIGSVTELQFKMTSDEWINKCPQVAAVIAWIDGKFEYFAHPTIITSACVGMLEIIKSTLVDTQLARRAANQQIILADSNGRPINRGQ